MIATASYLETVLGRRERDLAPERALELLQGERVLVTGAAGSIGAALVDLLEDAGIMTLPTDMYGLGLKSMDVRFPEYVAQEIRAARPTVILHCAGAKHAPEGERDPALVAETNALGTLNILRATPPGCRVVTVSTCKACDPETAYGASKLLAERATRQAGHTVARLYNVVEASGNVFETWRGIPADEPIPVTPCDRYFISRAEAVGLILWAAVLPPALYTVDPGRWRAMRDVAADLHPGRPLVEVPPRRGDRLREPRCARHERLELVGGGIERVTGQHDPA